MPEFNLTTLERLMTMNNNFLYKILEQLNEIKNEIKLIKSEVKK